MKIFAMILILAGMAAVAAGVGFFSIPWAVITAGVEVTALGIILILGLGDE